MAKKKCFKCKKDKIISKFYLHKGMSDGHINKCIDCCKEIEKERQKKLRKNPQWVEAERTRGREKYFRKRYINKQNPKSKKKTIAIHRQKYPEKYHATSMAQNIKTKKGNHKHHWSYNIEHVKDIIELPIIQHNKLHRYMIYDQERMMYRRCDTMELLDTKEKHLEYYEEIKNKD